MTIQNWSLWPDRATIVCDSLVSHAITNQPTGFWSKVWLAPHALTMIAGKGWSHPAFLMWKAVAEGVLPADIHEMARHAPEVFQAARQTAMREVPDFGAKTLAGCRMVIFGWDYETKGPCGYLFDARDAFSPRAFNHGELLMPDLAEARTAPDHWTRGLIQQAYDRSLPVQDRDNIGGTLIMAELHADDGHPTISVRCLGDMPHLESDKQSISE